MYQYNDFDRHFVASRAQQFRDQLGRWKDGLLSNEEFLPLRLQNGWYVQRYAPMLRIAVPYGEISAPQLRVLARIAREYDAPGAKALADNGLKLTHSMPGGLTGGYGHFSTRCNVQFNWISLDDSADVMDLLSSVNMHGIQTSGNCIRNISTDERAGIAVDEVADPRPFCEILRQWSTLHTEFAFLPRKFKIAVSGAADDRAVTWWHDIGLHLVKSAEGELGFRVLVGGGMGRTPVIATVVREFLPWNQIINYIEAIVRVYNRYGRRDNKYKARIKMLVKAEGQRFIAAVDEEYRQIVELDGAPHTIPQAELDRVSAYFVPPVGVQPALTATEKVATLLQAATEDDIEFTRWLQRNVAPHRDPHLRIVTLSFKRRFSTEGSAPGDASADQLDALAELADRFSHGEARITHDQNALLPWVSVTDLPALWHAARELGLARAQVRLLTDMIACPGGDFCSLANARSIPIAADITERYQDLDELYDLGEIDLHISGCINSCGHHHTGHIGILGVDKDGQEWYQITLGGSDGSALSGNAAIGRVVGPSFAAEEVVDVIEAVLTVYKQLRASQGVGAENFIDTLRRVGPEPFKVAANAARISTRQPTAV